MIATGRNQDAGEPNFINLRLVFAWRCDLLLYCTEAYQTLSLRSLSDSAEMMVMDRVIGVYLVEWSLIIKIVF